MNEQEKAKAMGQIIAKCWEDEAFKERFKTDTAAVLAEYGIEVKEGVKFNVIEEKEGVVDIFLPMNKVELSDDLLDQTSGGIIVACNCAPQCGLSCSCAFGCR